MLVHADQESLLRRDRESDAPAVADAGISQRQFERQGAAGSWNAGGLSVNWLASFGVDAAQSYHIPCCVALTGHAG